MEYSLDKTLPFLTDSVGSGAEFRSGGVAELRHLVALS
ncbi:hypothetical protein FB472_0181 [Rhodoglobus vestalii]|uniref:Uncharacterized protein n=1 Tax=Rhodoglobus vestalii TaxID=193384 RepID=A0A8H2K8G6_9MICO|nr:hypothetical protein FB472_0181 [Rhodoglobus vestalii]